MKNFYKFSVVALAFLTSNLVNAQLFGDKRAKNQFEENAEAKAEFNNKIQSNRVEARAKLKPYKYNGTKSTTFTYKTYDYVKTIEILTIEKTDYRFSFNSTLVKYGNIGIKIFDKPNTVPGRILLYENDDVGGGDFTISLDEMNEKFRESKAEKAAKTENSRLTPELISKMRLKKVYVEYHIPAVDRGEEVDSESDSDGNTSMSTRTIKYSAMVVAVGYKNER